MANLFKILAPVPLLVLATFSFASSGTIAGATSKNADDVLPPGASVDAGPGAEDPIGIFTEVATNTSRYIINKFKLNWVDALVWCEGSGGEAPGNKGSLVAIETPEEEKFLTNHTVRLGIDFAWTSGYYDEATWYWLSTGEPFGEYTNWKTNPPFVGEQYRPALWANFRSSNWQNIPQIDEHAFICEVPLDPEVPVPCDGANELIILLDGSYSVGTEHFQIGKEFVARLASAFDPPSRVGFILFDSSSRTIFALDNSLGGAGIQDAIRNVSYPAGSTLTYLALQDAIRQFVEIGRPKIPRKMVVLTDGKSQSAERTIEEAQRAKEEGIVGYTVGIGSNLNKDELVAIAGGIDKHMFTVETFENLLKLIRPVSLEVCK